MCAPCRAQLAKGTLNALGAHDVRVARGTDAGRKDEDLLHEFDSAPYLAAEDEVERLSGHELVFDAIRDAAEHRHYVSIVLNSATGCTEPSSASTSSSSKRRASPSRSRRPRLGAPSLPSEFPSSSTSSRRSSAEIARLRLSRHHRILEASHLAAPR